MMLPHRSRVAFGLILTCVILIFISLLHHEIYGGPNQHSTVFQSFSLLSIPSDDWEPFGNVYVNNNCTNEDHLCSDMTPIHVIPCLSQSVNHILSSDTGVQCDDVFLSHSVIQQAAQFRSAISPIPITPVIVLVEGRNDSVVASVIEYTLLNAIEHAPPAWRIRLMVKQPIIQYLNKLDWFIAMTRICDKIVVHQLNAEWIASKPYYNKFLSKHQFWTGLAPASRVQLIETDSGFCANSTRTLQHYVQYDFCGARWVDDNMWACHWNNTRDDTRCVGNSGFSIWNRAMMADLSGKYAEEVSGRNLNIDQFWGTRMRRDIPNIKICPYDDADLYSVETIMPNTSIPIAFHKPYFHFWTPDQVTRFHALCPAYKIIQAPIVAAKLKAQT